MKLKPTMSVRQNKPTNLMFRGRGSSFVPRVLGQGMLVGMMSLTYPSNITIQATP